jgi:DnaD/phage-associated family protein
MPNITIGVPYGGFTLLENAFIDNFLKDANGDFVRVYLLCLRLGTLNEQSSIEKIADSLNLLQADVAKALEYWVNNGAITYSHNGYIQLLPINGTSPRDNDLSVTNCTSEMLESLQRLVGRPLSGKELSTYLSMLEDFSFTPEVVTLLVEYCSSKKKTDIRYIEKVAMAWNENGIKTVDAAMTYITKHEEKWNNYRSILNFMGIKDPDISKPQEEFLERWLFKFNFPIDIIQEAVRICTMRISESNFSYIDKILADWNKNGIKSLSDINKSNKKPRDSKKTPQNSFGNYSGQRQYDPAELRKQLLGRGDTDEE